jgi:hypothetical protein
VKISILARRAALGVVLIYAAAPLVHAQQQEVVIETGTSPRFMSGGVGQDQQALMRAAAKDFNLRFEFSERSDDEFIVGSDLRITDLQGNPVFALPSAGPMVNVDLPEGRYRVSASFHGQNETRLVTLHGKAGQDLYFHWQGNAKVEPVAAVDAGAKAD